MIEKAGIENDDAPYAGARIETIKAFEDWVKEVDAPYAGARIETF